MAKKTARKGGTAEANGHGATGKRGEKTAAIKEYLESNRQARPKEVVGALKERGIVVSSNMVSMVKARMGIRRARRRARQAAASNHPAAATHASNAAGLEAALVLYKAARESADVPGTKIRQAFLKLVEILG